MKVSSENYSLGGGGGAQGITTYDIGGFTD